MRSIATLQLCGPDAGDRIGDSGVKLPRVWISEWMDLRWTGIHMDWFLRGQSSCWRLMNEYIGSDQDVCVFRWITGEGVAVETHRAGSLVCVGHGGLRESERSIPQFLQPLSSSQVKLISVHSGSWTSAFRSVCPLPVSAFCILTTTTTLFHFSINKVCTRPTYQSVNPSSSPLCRVCVQARLPVGQLLQMDVLLHDWPVAPGEECFQQRDTLHVQSVSHWAPANIGPYSQAVQVRSRRLHVYSSSPDLPRLQEERGHAPTWCCCVLL